MPGRRLILRFALISLALIAVVAMIVGWLAGRLLTAHMLEREQTLTVNYMQRVASQRIAPEELRAAWQLRSESKALGAVAEGFMLLPEVVRIKVYDPKGVVIWSDAPGLVGKDFSNDQSVRDGLSGKLVAEMEQIGASPEHEFEHPHFRELMSLYAPVRDPRTGELLALFEIYKYPQLLYELIRQGRRVLWAVVLLGGGILSFGQFGLVLAASRTINRQYADLRERADRLELINRQLKDTQAQLVDSERFAALGEVTAAVAHGIRNPLGNIRIVTQETREGLDPQSPLREPLTDVITQVDLLEERLRNFLSTAKPADLTLAPVHLLTVVQTAISGMRARFADKNIAVEIKPFDGDCSVQGDQVKLEEVVRILLSNSVEAGAQKITVGGCKIIELANGRGIEFHIFDDGAGLSAETSARLFEPFFTTKSLGTGLGLVIAKKMIEAHGGKLTLAPMSPHGADAAISLPLLAFTRNEDTL